MKYLFLFLLLTACGQKTDNAPAKPEADAENITNIALTKYEAKADLSLEELEALRKPVPDWETYKRLIKTEDGYDQLRMVYLFTNEVINDLNWYHEIYIDPKTHTYYHAKFEPTNNEVLQKLADALKSSEQQTHSKKRIVFVTNTSTSLKVYADALNDYKLYAAELKTTIDEYTPLQDKFTILPIMGDIQISQLKWNVITNRFMIFNIMYYPTTNGVPLVPSDSDYYVKDASKLQDDLTGNHPDIKDPYSDFVIKYNPLQPEVYYGVKYNFFGDIRELVNENPPKWTNYAFPTDEADEESEGGFYHKLMLGRTQETGCFWFY